MSKPHRCPSCDSAMVDYTKIEFDNNDNTSITAHGYCHACKSHFVEWHKTEFVGACPHKPDPYAGPAGAPVTYRAMRDDN